MFSVAVLLASGVGAARGQQFVIDSFNPNANGKVNVVVVQPDGKILIGGSFTKLAPNGGPEVTRNRIARLRSNGQVDQQFNPNANGAVYSIAVQTDGKILVGGEFHGTNSIGGQKCNYMARLASTNGAADSFNPNATDPVLAIAEQADHKILAGGGFLTIGGKSRKYMARLDATTGEPDSFNPTANEPVLAIVVQGDKILVGGSFKTIGGQPRNRIARLDATGAADSFNPDANAQVDSIAVHDDKILVGGGFTSIGGQPRNRIAQLDATGVADSFDPNANDRVLSIVVRNGKIVAGGKFTSIGGQTRNRIARMNLEGLLDSEFNWGANNDVLSIAVPGDNMILLGGNFTTLAPEEGTAQTLSRNRIARIYYYVPSGE